MAQRTLVCGNWSSGSEGQGTWQMTCSRCLHWWAQLESPVSTTPSLRCQTKSTKQNSFQRAFYVLLITQHLSPSTSTFWYHRHLTSPHVFTCMHCQHLCPVGTIATISPSPHVSTCVHCQHLCPVGTITTISHPPMFSPVCIVNTSVPVPPQLLTQPSFPSSLPHLFTPTAPAPQQDVLLSTRHRVVQLLQQHVDAAVTMHEASDVVHHGNLTGRGRACVRLSATENTCSYITWYLIHALTSHGISYMLSHHKYLTDAAVTTTAGEVWRQTCAMSKFPPWPYILYVQKHIHKCIDYLMSSSSHYWKIGWNKMLHAFSYEFLCEANHIRQACPLQCCYSCEDRYLLHGRSISLSFRHFTNWEKNKGKAAIKRCSVPWNV